jgi:hypothetical protein
LGSIDCGQQQLKQFRKKMSKLKQISKVALLVMVLKTLQIPVHFLVESGFVNHSSLTVSKP